MYQVIVEAWIDNPNVKAFISAFFLFSIHSYTKCSQLDAGLPGDENGNAIVDVLWGAVNPSGRLVYTMGKKASDYPANVVYTASSTSVVPQLTFTEGLFVDCKL